MASDLQSEITAIVQNDYSTLVAVTAIAYDYVLTFPTEIEYIWNKPWSLVSVLFFIVRYFGICSIIIQSIVGSTFVPGPAKVSGALGMFSQWAIFIFICAADLAMMLRLWAMYSRSKIVFGILGVFYLAEVIPSVIFCIIYSIPQNYSAIVYQIMDFNICGVGPSGTSFNWTGVSSTTQLIHAGVMCILVLIRFLAELFQMYKITKRWRLNNFMKLLVVQGILYFFVILFWDILNLVVTWGIFSPAGWQFIPTFLLGYIAMATLIPRFILSIRILYARGIQGDSSSGIDTGFGLSASSPHWVTKSAIVFVDGRQSVELEEEHREETSADEGMV